MEEEYNEHELEERFYSMLHYVDDKETCNIDKDEATRIVDSVPQSTVRRYWRTSADPTASSAPPPAPTPAAPPPTVHNQPNPPNTKPKEEKCSSPFPQKKTADVSIFQTINPQNTERTIEILDIEDDKPLELVTSDEDEVIEVALPPKPTITIESSDEDEVQAISQPQPSEENNVSNSKKQTKSPSKEGEREVSASPVPSVVSSVSDEFIRGDCIAFNISSRRPDNHSFDFSLHGSDLVGTPSKRKKKRKKKDGSEKITSTPVKDTTTGKSTNPSTDECFATPKSKAKNKRQKTKSYFVSEKSFPNPDVYDSDSNQSVTDMNNTSKSYKVTNRSLPNADVYESDSSQSEPIKEPSITHDKSNGIDKNDNEDVLDKTSDSLADQSVLVDESLNTSVSLAQSPQTKSFVDLTNDYDNTLQSDISENIVMANVTGFRNEEENDDFINNHKEPPDPSKLGSTRIPAILNEDLDFDNLKGNSQICQRRKFSLSTFRAEMEKFYNESWGGEEFNHREIQKSMSRDKKLWVIDPKDRMPSHYRKKITCNYCNRVGHRDDTCRLKPAVCFMCGDTGHYESRCPRKICVNCGSPNFVYSNMCRNCSTWSRVTCAECQQLGHPASHCPDVWRRYHNTLEASTPLVENRCSKRYTQQFCSGCTRRGHLVHSCRLTLPFSGLPINSPYVIVYSPVYTQHNNVFMQDGTISSATFTPKPDRNKRHSKSPTVHETHVNKKRNTTLADNKSPLSAPRKRNSSTNKDVPDTDSKLENSNVSDTGKTKLPEVEKAPDFIPVGATNRDKMGHVIQDNEVSDTSDVVTSARIYVTNDIVDKLKSKEGEQWLKDITQKHNVVVQHTDINLFLSVSGKVADQESFQTALRDWARVEPTKEASKPDNVHDVPKDSGNQEVNSDIPKNRNNVLRKLGKALDLLKNDIGDPNALFKELTYLQNHHQQLLKRKVISPKKLANNRDNINEMLKKLNMVLLGQAGLADGSRHLKELHTLQEKLIKYRQKNIPVELRREIGEHYHSIFSAVQRDDYVDLLKRYYRSKKYRSLFKWKKSDNCLTSNSSLTTNNSFTPNQSTQKVDVAKSPHVQNNVSTDTTTVTVNDSKQPNKTPNPCDRDVTRTYGKLRGYHKRVKDSKPMNPELKTRRLVLTRKLHSHIACLANNQRITNKTLKKIIKTEQQAISFLSNV